MEDYKLFLCLLFFVSKQETNNKQQKKAIRLPFLQQPVPCNYVKIKDKRTKTNSPATNPLQQIIIILYLHLTKPICWVILLLN